MVLTHSHQSLTKSIALPIVTRLIAADTPRCDTQVCNSQPAGEPA